MAENDPDILGKLNSDNENIKNDLHASMQYLHHIDESTTRMLDMLSHMSQTSARGFAEDRNREQRERQTQSQNSTYKNTRSSSSSTTNWTRRSSGKPLDDFLDSFEEEFIKDIAGGDFKKKIKESLSEFADNIGVSLEDIPGDFGKELASILSSKIKESSRGQKWSQSFSDLFQSIYDSLSSGFEKGVNKYRTWAGTNDTTWSWEEFRNIASHGYHTNDNTRFNSSSVREEAENSESKNNSIRTFSNAVDKFDSSVTQFSEIFAQSTESQQSAAESMKSAAEMQLEAAEESSGASGTAGLKALTSNATSVAEDTLTSGEMMSGVMSSLSSMALSLAKYLPQLLAVVAVMTAVKAALSAFTPVVEGAKNMLDEFKNAANRDNAALDKMTENFETRFAADIETMVRYPFEILEDAANEVYDVWDNLLREINGTQGYTKADLQDLMAAYSQRLQAEGLGAVVSTTDVTESLAKVLEAGLSGTAAEEFAYLATVLNAAIPTQDFFDYADTYAQLATIAIQNGYSESEAIAYANDQIESFASSILYASRELSGGFTTGLSNASDLMASAVSIAQAAGSSNYSEIGAVMAATSSYIGSIAPALESSITDLIVQLATGGNNSQLTALRSLAGTGASNTAFLNAFTENPQQVLYNLFSNLSGMQNMSNNAYMEVAESLSDLFGISMDALSQIDFQGLANAIGEMTINSSALADNLSMLASGETTTSAEEQRMAQINEYMSTEGLSYVLDNEAARAVQEHLWEQEIADQLIAATFAVDLKGSGLELMNSIDKMLNNFAKIFTFKWVDNIQDTYADLDAYVDEITNVLEEGRIESDITDSLNAASQYTSTNNSNLFNYSGSYDLSGVNDILTVMGNTNSQLGTSSGYEVANSLVKGTSLSVSSSGIDTGNTLAGVNSEGNEVTTYTPESYYRYNTVSKNQAAEMNALQGGYSEGIKVGHVENYASGSGTASAEISSASMVKLESLVEEIPEAVASGESYEDWVDAAASKYGIADVSSLLEDLGYDINYLSDSWNENVVNESALENQRRNEKEEAFWDSTLEWFDETTIWREAESEYWKNLFGGDDNYWVTWFEDTNRYWQDWFDVFNDTWTGYHDVDQEYWQGWYTDDQVYWQEWWTADQLDRWQWRDDTNSAWTQLWEDTNTQWTTWWDTTNQTWTSWWDNTNQTWTDWWEETNQTWTDWWEETNETWTEWWTETFYDRMNELWEETNDLLTTIHEEDLDEHIYREALGADDERTVRQSLNEDIFKTALEQEIYNDALLEKIHSNDLDTNIYNDALITKIHSNDLDKNIYQEALIKQIHENDLDKHIYEGALGSDSKYATVRKSLDGYIYQDALGKKDKADSVRANINDYLDKWTDYYWGDEYSHYYSSFSGKSGESLLSSVTEVQKSKDNEEVDAIYELANVLTENVKDFTDPQVQTNVLLAQILNVTATIMEQTNQVEGTYSLSDQLTGLASGLLNGAEAEEA